MKQVFKKEPDPFIEEIKAERLRLLRELSHMSVTDEAYDNAVRQLKLIEEVLDSEDEKHKIKPAAILSAVVSMSSILLILQHEKLNVISTKALGFVKRHSA